MSKIKYLVSSVINMNYKRLGTKINEVHNKTKKNKLLIIIDMIVCGIKYQAGYSDYALFKMYNLNSMQRKTVMTRGKNNAIIKRFNDKRLIHIFENKDEFNEKYKKFIKRDWMILNDTNFNKFKKFVSNKETIICKPTSGSCGKGIEKIKISDFKDLKVLYNHLMEKKLFVLEEVLKQHQEMNKLNDSCINTVRVITLYNNKPNVVAAYLRIGIDKFVDNFNSGGMVVPVNEKTGEIEYPALDKAGKLYEIHPGTKTKIKGFKIPEWDQVLKLALALSDVIKEVGVVGWDIAITPDGPTIVEGNDYPGHDIYQLPPHRTNGIGVYPKFKQYL